MNNSVTIRLATENNAEAIAALIRRVSHYFLSDPSGAGAEGFLASLSPTAVAGYIADPGFRYIAAFVGDQLVGVAALRDDRHIYHLFVSPEHHRRGIATRLWLDLASRALAAGNTAGFTVNASIFAVPVYARWGFVATAAPQDKNGISFQAMHLPLQGAVGAPAQHRALPNDPSDRMPNLEA